MTLEELKQIITNCKFDSALKQRLDLILPNLGKYTLSGLGKEVSRGDSVLIAESIVLRWENFAKLLSNIKSRGQNSSQNLTDFLNENLNIINGETEFYILNFVFDLRVMASSGQARLTEEQEKQIIDYEILLFWHLPKEEVLFLFRNKIMYLLNKIDLLKDTEVVVYENDWDFDENFNTVLLDALYQNKEILGVNGKKTVGMWIKDFYNFASGSRTSPTAFGIAEFMAKDPVVQKLAKSERENLSEILRLFVWLLDPLIDEAEVRSYKESVSDERFARVKEAFLQADKQEESRLDLSLANQVKDLPNLDSEGLVSKTENVVPQVPLAKKIDIQEILNRGSGVRIGNQQDIGNSKLEIGEQGQRIKPVVPVKKVESGSADRSNRTDRTNETNRTQDLTSPGLQPSSPRIGEEKNESLLQIRQDIQKKKQMAQAEIDKRLESLKNRKANN